MIALDCRLAGHSSYPILDDVYTGAGWLTVQSIQHLNEKIILGNAEQIIWHSSQGIFLAAEFFNLKSNLLPLGTKEVPGNRQIPIVAIGGTQDTEKAVRTGKLKAVIEVETEAGTELTDRIMSDLEGKSSNGKGNLGYKVITYEEAENR